MSKTFQVPAIPFIVYLFMTVPLIICGAHTAVLLYFGEEIIADVILKSLKLSYMVTVPLTILVAVNLIDPIIAPGTHKDIIDVEE